MPERVGHQREERVRLGSEPALRAWRLPPLARAAVRLGLSGATRRGGRGSSAARSRAAARHRRGSSRRASRGGRWRRSRPAAPPRAPEAASRPQPEGRDVERLRAPEVVDVDVDQQPDRQRAVSTAQGRSARSGSGRRCSRGAAGPGSTAAAPSSGRRRRRRRAFAGRSAAPGRRPCCFHTAGLRLLSGGLFGSERAFGSATAGKRDDRSQGGGQDEALRDGARGRSPAGPKPAIPRDRARRGRRKGRQGLSAAALPGPIRPACRSRSRSSMPAGSLAGNEIVDRLVDEQLVARVVGAFPRLLILVGRGLGLGRLSHRGLLRMGTIERKPPRSPEAPWRVSARQAGRAPRPRSRGSACAGSRP